MSYLSPRLLIAAGVFCTASCIGYFVLTNSGIAAPGRLVATQAVAEWQSTPPDETRADQSMPARFLLKNVGGRQVTIRDVRSGCGCAKPKIDRNILRGGESATLLVDVTPIEIGSKTISIEVETDSRVTPSLPLELVVKGWRKPPYLQSVLGDLTFRDDRPGTALTFEISSFSMRGDETSLPLTCSLPFITLEHIETTRKEAPDGSNVVLRIQRFVAKLVQTPPDPSAIGEVAVDDPWNPGRRLTMPVRFEMPPPLRVAPSRVSLRISEPSKGAEFLVLGRDDLPAKLEVVAEEPDSPVTITRQDSDKASRRVAKYRVTLKPGTSGRGPYRLAVRGVGESAIVQVSVE
jgi:hypothetical protein